MTQMPVKLAVVVATALLATGCIASEERSGPGADGDPVVSGQCAEDHPDCEDTVVVGDVPTGGDTPLAPDAQSGGFVVGDGLTIADAIAYEGTEVVAVHGYLVRTGESARLCEALAESFPPQCGGSHLTITNPELITEVVLVEEGDVQWSPEEIVLLGHMSGTDLTVEVNVSASA